jgi:hypothetical protein
MTQRSAHAEPPGCASPDFSRLDCTEARKRVRQLIVAGLPESQVADLIGWSVGDVRRACWPAIAISSVRDANA